MLFKVTIAKGKGKVSCRMPSFILDEEKSPACIVDGVASEEMDQLKKAGFINWKIISEGEYEELLKSVSAEHLARAKMVRRAQVERDAKTGGVEEILTSGGLVVTVEPADDISPDEIKKMAKDQLKKDKMANVSSE